MNIHEYQAKSLLRDFGIPVPNGVVIDSLSDLIGLEEKLSGSKFVVKSQIHAGGRGAGFLRMKRLVAVVSHLRPISRMLKQTLKEC